MALIYNASFDSQTRILSLLDKAGNVISSCEVPSKELVDDPNKPLMLRAIEDNSSVTLKKNGTLSNTYQTSTNGKDWTDYTLGTQISLNNEDVIYFRCSNHPTTQSFPNCVQFVMTGKIEAWHNAYSMISSSFTNTGASVGDYGMCSLFENCTSLTKAPLLLNALSESCYSSMFNRCYSLVQAPALPATALARYCYSDMFRACSSLVQAPSLPATALAPYCYNYLFFGCYNLKEVRVSATTTSTGALDSWLSGVSATGDFYCDPNATIFPTDSASGIPKGWRRIPPVDDVNKPLMFRATQDGSTVKLFKIGSPFGDFQTSRDGGKTWTDYTIDTAITLNVGDEVAFRAKENRTNEQSTGVYFRFTMTGKIEAWHNVMSLYRKDDFATYESVVPYAFSMLFYNCHSLTKSPVLPATTLADSCYYGMFFQCTSLAEAPELPATALAPDCYYYMFLGCRSLVEAHELPATTLESRCYYGMFDSCRSMTKAPALPATTLAEGCYVDMFRDCSSLSEVHCQMPSTISAEDIPKYTATTSNKTYPWLAGVSSTGTFYTNEDAHWPSGTSGIPTGWNRVNEREKDYITKPLMFRATQDNSTVTLTQKGSPSGAFQTSRDGGNTWTDYIIGTVITLNVGDEVSFRAKADRTSGQSISNYFYFTMTGKIEAWHNVMSLYLTDDFATYNTVMYYAFYALFDGCASLTKAPVLPATTLAIYCYASMFNDCTSLTKAPELPATTLVNFCYQNMFSMCTLLAQAPSLPATTLANYCYRNMFDGCTALKEVRISATTTATDALNNWLYGVAATGDFYCSPDATIFPTGGSGIPQNWTRHALADYPVNP